MMYRIVSLFYLRLYFYVIMAARFFRKDCEYMRSSVVLRVFHGSLLFPALRASDRWSNPRAFVSAFVQPTDADVDSLDSFMDEPVDFFLNSLVVLWFCLSYAAAAVTGHHRGQNGIFRIVFEKGCAVLEGRETADSGTDLIRVETGECCDFFHSGSPPLYTEAPAQCAGKYRMCRCPCESFMTSASTS